MKKYTLTIDQLFKVWQTNRVEIEFDGTEEELVEIIQEQEGNLDNLDVQFLDTQTLCETEVFQNEYEIMALAEANL